MAKILIGPGHAPGSVNGGPNGYKEYKGIWTLSNYLKLALERCGATVALTREENTDLALADRGAKAKGYDVFISEHSNAHDGKVRGCECYYSVKRYEDKVYAAKLTKTSAALMGNNDRGAKTRLLDDGATDYYGVIRSALAAGCPHMHV